MAWRKAETGYTILMGAGYGTASLGNTIAYTAALWVFAGAFVWLGAAGFMWGQTVKKWDRENATEAFAIVFLLLVAVSPFWLMHPASAQQSPAPPPPAPQFNTNNGTNNGVMGSGTQNFYGKQPFVLKDSDIPAIIAQCPVGQPVYISFTSSAAGIAAAQKIVGALVAAGYVISGHDESDEIHGLSQPITVSPGPATTHIYVVPEQN